MFFVVVSPFDVLTPLLFGKFSITIPIDILIRDLFLKFHLRRFFAFIFKNVINPLNKISIQLLEYVWWKKSPSCEPCHSSGATIIINNWWLGKVCVCTCMKCSHPSVKLLYLHHIHA